MKHALPWRALAATWICLSAGWISLSAEHVAEPSPPTRTATAVPYESPYPPPRVDPSAAPQEPAPTF